MNREDTKRWVPRMFVAVLLSLSAMPVPAQPLLHATVAEGSLAGKAEGSVAAYLGVPFAAPPVGENRWRSPGKPAIWKGERHADRFGASCQQRVRPDGFGPWTSEYVITGEVSEDCLTLNVWTPAQSAQDKLPVLVWIYGGGFNSGGSSVAVYNGARLASHGILVVSFNYRVGVYGFFAHPELTAESAAHASGNYGLLDQVAALRWIHENIASFGGDPARVTIAGQSAGGASVNYLIASPLAKGLFSRAIAQSGSGMGLTLPDRASAEAMGSEVGKVGGEGQAAGDGLSLAQLRKLSAAELDARLARASSSGAALTFAPIVDGLFFPNATTVGANTNDTPILTGMVANEGSAFNSPDKMTPANFSSQLVSKYGKLAPDFAALYSATDSAQAAVSFDALSRDGGLAAQYFWALGRLPHTRYPIYAYLWTHTEPGPDAARYLAFHSSELAYVFDTLDVAKRPFTEVDRKLAVQLSTYWVNFVKSGDPNGGGQPRWPALSATDMQILEIGDATKPRAVLEANKLRLFERYTKGGGQLGLF